MHRFVIVGIDPGATIGIAILDLSGKKIITSSILGGGISEATRFIEQHGTPSLIACDVNPVPDAVSRIASFFSCRAHSPVKEIREEEKRKVSSPVGVANNHERDAYCAATFAYRAYANKFRQIDSLEEFPASDKEKVKHLVLKGYRMKDAFLELEGTASVHAPGPESALAVQKQEASQRSFSTEELRARISSLARENSHLRMLSDRLESENRQLADKLHLLENGVRETVLRDSEFRKLRFQLGLALGKLQGKQKQMARQNQQKHTLPSRVAPRQSQRIPSGGKIAQVLSKPAQLQNQKPAISSQKKPPIIPTPVSQKRKSGEAGLYNLGEGNLDLDKMVAEYRREKK